MSHRRPWLRKPYKSAPDPFGKDFTLERYRAAGRDRPDQGSRQQVDSRVDHPGPRSVVFSENLRTRPSSSISYPPITACVDQSQQAESLPAPARLACQVASASSRVSQ